MKKNQFPRFALLILIIISFCLVGRYLSIDIDYYRNLLSQFPLLVSAVIYIALYVAFTTFIWTGPGSIFRITGAVIFGASISTLFVAIAEIINAAIIFYLSRILGRDWIEHRFKIKTKQIDRFKADSGILWVFALRINPLIPFRPMDVGFGLSQVKFVQYIIPTFLGSVPRIFWLQYILEGVGEGILKDPKVLYDFLINNPILLKYSVFFFLFVFALTGIAIILKKKQRGQTP